MRDIFNVKGDVAVVTGGGSGIGRRFCQVLAAAGAEIAVVDLDQAGMEETCRLLAACEGNHLAVKTDVADQDSVEKMVKEIVEELGKPTILVNCAGISSSNRIEEMTLTTWKRVLNVLLNGTFLCSRAVIPYMKEAGRGKIINIGSIAALTVPRGHPGTHNYSAGKAGVLAFTRTLAVECARDNVNVNAISPGFIETPLTRKAVEDKTRREEMVSNLPLGRLGKTSDLDGAVLFLASRASDYVTGHNLVVDGGYLLW